MIISQALSAEDATVKAKSRWPIRGSRFSIQYYTLTKHNYHPVPIKVHKIVVCMQMHTS